MTTLQKMLGALDNRELEEAMAAISARFGGEVIPATRLKQEQHMWEEERNRLLLKIRDLEGKRRYLNAFTTFNGDGADGTLERFQYFLEQLDDVKPVIPDKENANRGYALRFFILLALIARESGRTQSYYTEKLKWTKQSINNHVLSLKAGGFIEYEEAIGVSYKNKPPKALRLTIGGENTLKDLLRIFDPNGLPMKY